MCRRSVKDAEPRAAERVRQSRRIARRNFAGRRGIGPGRLTGRPASGRAAGLTGPCGQPTGAALRHTGRGCGTPRPVLHLHGQACETAGEHGSLAGRGLRTEVARWTSLRPEGPGRSLNAMRAVPPGRIARRVRACSEGRLVLVAGEAGVGKTALLRGSATRSAGRCAILWGGCEPLRTPRPLGPLLDVAEAVGGELEELVARTGEAARGGGGAARASCAAGDRR